MPLANAFLPASEANSAEPRIPLAVIRCKTCSLLRLSVVVDPELMFRHYLYTTSASAPMVSHFESYAEEIVDRFALKSRLVVELGSNDGMLLKPLQKRGAEVVGVEPATNLAQAANDADLFTVNAFFSPEVAAQIQERSGQAGAILGNNVLAHIDDLDAVLGGLDILLAPDGVVVVEVPYLVDLLDRVEYDTIYHEHLSYFALAPLEQLFSRASFEVFDVRRLGVHGGSLRVFAARTGRYAISETVAKLRAAEVATGITDDAMYATFAARVAESRSALRQMVVDLKSSGHSIAGLGASAKGNTLLNYCGFGRDEIAFIADSTPLKQGRVTPGTYIPIREERALGTERPDFTLLLAWNYADAVLARHAAYIKNGGRFIHPIPLARLIP